MKKTKKYKEELHDYNLTTNPKYSNAKLVMEQNEKHKTINKKIKNFKYLPIEKKLEICFPLKLHSNETKIVLKTEDLSINSKNRTIFHPTKNKKYNFEIFCMYITDFKQKKHMNKWCVVFYKTTTEYINGKWLQTKHNYELYIHSDETVHYYPSIDKISKRLKKRDYELS